MSSKALKSPRITTKEKQPKSKRVYGLPDATPVLSVQSQDAGQDTKRRRKKHRNDPNARNKKRKRRPNVKPYVMSQPMRERLRLVIYLYRSGCSASEIGEAIGVTKQRVLQLLRAACVERRACGNVRRGAHGRYSSLLQTA